MSKHMNLLETIKWSQAHGFSVDVHSTKNGLLIEINDLDGIIPNAELHCSFLEIDKIEKVLAEVMSDLYLEKNEINKEIE